MSSGGPRNPELVLEKISDEDVRVFSVYLPILRGDQESSVASASKLLPDKRVSYFWDGKSQLAQSYADVLQMPRGQPAWDIYLASNRDVEWSSKPPAPDYWMHQLGGQPPERRLNGERFAEETNKLLRITKRP